MHRPEKDWQDPTDRLVNPVTGKLVPDPAAKLPYMEYVGAKQAEWPKADFIVGNPPYIGDTAMREALGSGYVDAIRLVHPELPPGIDLVMYWWWRGAMRVVSGATLRCGLITTNSIVQQRNRAVVSKAQDASAEIVWAAPDHPWVDDADGAAVRVAMTVTASGRPGVALATVSEDGTSHTTRRVAGFNPDLTAGIDVTSTGSQRMLANDGLAFAGFQLYGNGFVLDADEAMSILAADPINGEVIKPYRNGRDFTSRPRGVYVVDFALRSEAEARRYPVPFNLVADRVKPVRDSNRRDSLRTGWWRFGYPRVELREAIAGTSRFIVTPETAKHRFFLFVDIAIAPDNMLTIVASSDPFVLGILSSSPHCTWALATGARLEDRPRYTKSLCYHPFPFADPGPDLRDQIGAIAERLDTHRKDAIARDETVTVTKMYNVVEKLRSGEALTAKERKIHEIAACGVLKDLHDDLDALVAEAYGWPWPMEREEILERLVALHDERVEEEKRGIIRWLRPEYQIPRFALKGAAAELDLGEGDPEADDESVAPLLSWPATAVEQLEALAALVARKRVTVDDACAAFERADPKLVARHLETLAMLGEIAEEDGWYGGVGLGG